MTKQSTSARSLDNFGLQSFALVGDDEGVQGAIDSGANVNAFDASGRTALMCAIAGEHWNDVKVSHGPSFMTERRLKAIEILLMQPNISLSTLNAPQSAFNDATPLEMAAWLDMPDAVRVLLDESLGTVSVNCMDMHGATPLMYAARDGSMEIVQMLLLHGARPDFRDRNHRTSIQYALQHPQILYLCESILRRHRLRELKSSTHGKEIPETNLLLELCISSISSSSGLRPPSPSTFMPITLTKATETIVQSVLSSDIQFLHSLLFSPPLPPSAPPSLYPLSCPLLVNSPDTEGWSPIHYCASAPHPRVDVLDALYCAGADIALFTVKEHYTALHCIAMSYHPDEVTMDTTSSLCQFIVHLVRDLRAPLSARDMQGETCIHIAAEHGHSFELMQFLLECDTTGSVRELRNSRGFTALEVAQPEFRAAFGVDAERFRPESAFSTLTIRPVTSFSSLKSFSDWNTSVGRDQDDDGDSIICSDFDIATASPQLIDNLRITSPFIHHNADSHHLNHLGMILRETEQLSSATLSYFRTRAEETSQALHDLEVDVDDTSSLLESISLLVDNKLRDRGLVAISPRRLPNRDSEDSQMTAVCTPFGTPPPTPSSISERSRSTESLSGSNGKTAKNDLVVKKSKIGVETKSVSFSASRLMSWLKRTAKSATDGASTNTSGAESAVIKEVTQGPRASLSEEDSDDIYRSLEIPVDSALQISHVVLGAAERDLVSIKECLFSAKQFMDSATRSILRAERIIDRAVKARIQIVKDLRVTDDEFDDDDDLFIRPVSDPSSGLHSSNQSSHHLSPKPSFTSLSSVSSVRSYTSKISFGGILAENDDEDIKAIRRLLLRKIEARQDGALGEIEKVVGWLRTIKEVIRGVKRRTYV